MKREQFYYILNNGLWNGACRSKGFSLSENDIDSLFEMGRLQAVSGLLMTGVNECGISLGNKKLKWIQTLMDIEHTNRKMELLAERIISTLKAEGLDAHVFKGVSVAQWYRNPLARSYGDIDIVVTKEFNRIANILQNKGVSFKREHQDIVCRIEGINVEFHPQREYIYCSKDNRTLQKLVNDFSKSKEVYLACLIVHMRRHFLTYGVGMKQVCDVAVMLKNASLNMDFLSEIIRQLNMEKFCAALFGFIKRRMMVDAFPIEPDCGRNSLFIEETVWKDGYLLKINRESHNVGLSGFRRVIGNTWFWMKRCIRMSYIMPREAIWFIPYIIKRRFH